MRSSQDKYLVSVLKKSSFYAAILVMAVSFLIMTGWAIDSEVLGDLYSRFDFMRFNTALNFLLSAAAILFLHKLKESDWFRITSVVLAVTVFLVGFITFLQYVFITDLGIDELFITDQKIPGEFPGRMSMNTSMSFMVIGSAIFLNNFRYRAVLTSQLLSLTLVLSSFLPLLGYIYAVPELSGTLVFTRMTFQTAVMLFFTSAALLFTFPERGLISIITTNSVGGYIARRLLPLSVFLPIIFIWFLVIMERNELLDISGSINLIAVFFIMIFILLAWRFMSSIGLMDQSRSKAINKAQLAHRHLHYNVENSPLALIEWDNWLRVTRWTKQAEELFGWKAGEVTGKSPEDWRFFHEEDKPGIVSSMQKIISGAYIKNKYSNRNYDKQGNILNCIWYNSAIPDVEGKVTSIISMVDNITRQKDIEKRLRESENQYRSLIEITKEAIFINQHNQIVYLNPAALELFGAESQEQVLGKSPLEFFHKDYHSLIRDRVERMLRGETLPLAEEKVVRLDGTIIDVEVAATCFKFKDEAAIQVVARSISERKRVEEILKRNEFLLRMAGNLTNIGGWMVDVKEKKVSWSEQVSEIHQLPPGYFPSPDEALKFFAPEYHSRITDAYSKCLKEGIAFDEEVEIITGYGSRVWVRFTGMAERDPSGTIIRVIGGIQDITEKKIYERNLQNALRKAEQSDKLKTAFLNNLSHEIRTPLNAIVGFSEILNQERHSPDRIRYLTGVIAKSSDQLMAIIENIINISTIDTGQTEVFEIETNIDALFIQLHDKFRKSARVKDIELHSFCDVSGGNSIVMTDEGKVRSVLTHLIDNAIKFTDKGKVEFGCSLNGDFLQFYVSDTGIGIEPSFHTSVFERFGQVEIELSRKRGGIGLGLPISRHFVETLQGVLWLESVPGEGTTVYFTIPWKPLKVAKKETTEKLLARKEFKLLVAEDEESNFFLIHEMLSGMNLDILHAWNGRQAVEMVEKNKRIDLVLMDIKMPVMGGFEAASLIKELRPEIPVVALTAHALQGDREKALNAGFDDYISKPFPLERLKGIIDRFYSDKFTEQFLKRN
jgi:PAS domain S-box-containing protein